MKADFSLTKEGKTSSLIAKGDLTAHSSALLKEHLQKLLNEPAAIEMKLEQVGAMDVSAIQLIKSWQTEITKTGRKLQLAPPSNNELIGLLIKTGLIKVIQDNI